jgi:DNA-binding LytR/AlgR family response regulator
MPKLAICDDQIELTEKLRQDLRKIFAKIGVDTKIEVYGRGEDLIADLKGGEIYDLIFLDINLISLNGIDVGNFIREKDNGYSTQIVFISNEKEYAFELFDISPIDFLVKPLNYHRLEKLAEKFMKMHNHWSDYFTYKVGRDAFTVKISDIIYMQSEKRRIRIYLTGGVDVFYGKLEDLYNQTFKKHRFLYIHNQTLVNYAHVRILEYEKLTMSNGMELTISHSKRKEIREARMEFEKGEMWVE